MKTMKTTSFWAPARRHAVLAQSPSPIADLNSDIPAFKFTGIVPQNIETGLILGAGGAGVAALSGLLPDTAKPIGIVSGVLISGLGVYKIYQSIFGSPKEEICEIPTQPAVAMGRVQAEFLAPVDKGKAELSTVWNDFWKSNRTYVLKFRLINNSDQDLMVPVQVKVTEHPAFLEEKVSTANFCVKVASHGQKTVDGFLPLFSDHMFDVSCVGQLILKHPSPAGQDERILQVIRFTV